MKRKAFVGFFLIATTWLAAQEGGDKSGPAVGSLLPGPFEVFNLNGDAKGRFHCLVVQNNVKPVVLVFAKEDKAASLDYLIQKLEEAQEKHANLAATVVLLSPDFPPPPANLETVNPEALAQQLKKRDAAVARLSKAAEAGKKTIFGCFDAEGPKHYKLNPATDITVVFYNRLKVIDNFSMSADKLTNEEADRILSKVAGSLK